MIIAHATDAVHPDQKFCLLGLSRENISKLIAGLPIRISHATHREGAIPGWVIGIVFGETEQEIWDELAKKGVMSDTVKVTVVPGL